MATEISKKNTALFHGMIHQANCDILTGPLARILSMDEIGIEIGIEHAAPGMDTNGESILELHPFVL